MHIVREKWCLLYLGLTLAALAAPRCAAREATEAEVAAESESQSPRLVLRMSGALLNGLLNRQIDFEIPYRDVVLGTPVSGTARVVGQPRVELAESPDQASFNIVVTGTVESRTTGQSGPAVIHGHSLTHFQATKEIAFEPGRGFFARPAQVAAETHCFLDGVQSKRRGVLGQLVMRKAAREFADQQSELTAVAKERAIRRIAQAFEQNMGQRLAQLNEIVQTSARIADAGENSSRLRIVCKTTPSNLEIAVARDDRSASIQLPDLAAGDASALIEIWFHNSLLPEPLGDAVTTLFSKPDRSGVLGAFRLVPGKLGQDAEAVIHELVSEDKIAVHDLGEWTVVGLNLLPTNKVFVARTLRR